jgi:tRNA threonylcarbamoyladenosine biosynthesis protein TsaB
MATILNLETATPLCSVALATDGTVLCSRETSEEKAHASRLTVFIEEVLTETGMAFDQIDAVAIGKGPGSYTGLRIGVSTAKGLCYGTGIPLIAVDTLQIMIKKAIDTLKDRLQNDMLFCPMIDARRMEVFTCLSTADGEMKDPVSARIIDETTFSGILENQRICFFGTGMEKCRQVIKHPNAIFLQDIFPHAGTLAILSHEKFRQQAFENVAYFEPFYLKDFIATIPKKVLPVQ